MLIHLDKICFDVIMGIYLSSVCGVALIGETLSGLSDVKKTRAVSVIFLFVKSNLESNFCSKIDLRA